MPSNDPEYQRIYKQKHYADNKQKYIDQHRARCRKLRKEVDEIKSGPCADCGRVFNPWQMHFDHRDNDRNGDMPISNLVNRGARKRVYQEIEKCDIVCANCHADRTHTRMLAAFV